MGESLAAGLGTISAKLRAARQCYQCYNDRHRALLLLAATAVQEAYTAMLSGTVADVQLDCMQRLVHSLCNAGQLRLLCALPFSNTLLVGCGGGPSSSFRQPCLPFFRLPLSYPGAWRMCPMRPGRWLESAPPNYH